MTHRSFFDELAAPALLWLLVVLSLVVAATPGISPGITPDIAATTPTSGGATSAPAASATAPGMIKEPLPADGPTYLISSFDLVYLRQDPGQPPLEEVAKVQVRLGQTDAGFVAPRPGIPGVTLTVADLSSSRAHPFFASALQKVLEAIRDYYTPRHFMGVFVAPEPTQIDSDGKDLRPAGHTALNLVVTLGAVTKMRTLAAGDRIPEKDRINNPLHARILEQSPVRPETQPAFPGGGNFGGGNPGGGGDLIRRDLLDDYVLRLSRHPGRRVDYSLAPGPDLGGVTLDYAVTESKPWLVYAELSNTGTSNTNRLREQFGFRHYQLTNNDDILAIDYSTAGFDRTHSLAASYEAPVGQSQRLRSRAFGGWSQYTASDVGQTGADFSGDSWNLGGELIANVYQDGPLFVDVVGGGRYETMATSNTIPGTAPGEAGFFIPHIGARVERLSEWSSLRASITAEGQFSWINHAHADRLAELGRRMSAHEWTLMHWDVSESVFLEPLLARLAGNDPLAGKHPTLAHELFLALRGQTAFGGRIVPQYESVDGGLYTVRGYPEAVVAGDDAILGTAEYRFHIPRALSFEPEPDKLFGKSFRYAPQQTYGPTDWDLAPRVFLDVATVHNSRGAAEPATDQTLIGAGVGCTFEYKRNVTFRVDWGFPLEGVPGVVKSEASRLHFVLTLLY